MLRFSRGITFLAHVSSDGNPEAVNIFLKLDGESFHFWQWVNINGVHGEDRKFRDLHRNRRYHWHRSNWHWVAYYVHDETWPCLPNNPSFRDNSPAIITRNDMQMREILEESTEEWKDGGREENRTEKEFYISIYLKLWLYICIRFSN